VLLLKTLFVFIILGTVYISAGEWRKLQSEKLNDLYSSPNIFRVIKSGRIRWTGHVACTGERRDVYMVLVGKPEGKRPFGRPRRRWEYNIKMDLREVGCDGMNGFHNVEAPRFQDSRHMKVARLSALNIGHLYPPGNVPGTYFC